MEDCCSIGAGFIIFSYICNVCLSIKNWRRRFFSVAFRRWSRLIWTCSRFGSFGELIIFDRGSKRMLGGL